MTPTPEQPVEAQTSTRTPQKRPRPARRRLVRVAGWLLALFTLCLATGFGLLHLLYNNEALARRLSERFNHDRRGQLAIGRVNWRPQALWALATGGTTRITVTGLRLTDSRGQVVLHLPRVVVEVRPRELLRGGSITIPAVQAAQGHVAWETYPRPDGPTPRGETHEVGLLGALERRPRAPSLPPGPTPSAPRTPAPPTKPAKPAKPAKPRLLAIARLTLDDFTVRGYKASGLLLLRGVSVRGGLCHATGSQAHETLQLDLGASSPGGHLRVRTREIPLSRLTLTARSGTGAARDIIQVAGALRAENAPVTLVGQVHRAPARRHPELHLTAQAQRFGALMKRLGKRPIRDENSRLTLTVTGPWNALSARAHLAGLRYDLDTDLHADRDMDAPLVVSSTVTYAGDQVLLESAEVRAWGGRAQVTGWLTRDTGNWGFDAQILSLNAPWFLRRHMHEIDLDISGMAHGMGSLLGTRRRRTFVTLLATRRTETSPMPQAAVVLGSLSGSPRLVHLEEVVAHSELGTLLASGDWLVPKGHLDLEIRLRSWQMRRHLEALGYRPYIDGVDLVGRFHGPAINPSFAGTLQLNDVRFQMLRLPWLRSPAAFTEGTLVADDLRSPLYGRFLSASVHLTLYETSLRHLRRPTLDFDIGLGR